MALKIDTCNAALAWRRSETPGAVWCGRSGSFWGSPFRMTLPAVRGSAGDWARESGA